jgi:hypothetical protein
MLFIQTERMKKFILASFLSLSFMAPVRAQWGADVFLFFVQMIGTCDEGGYEYKQTLFKDRTAELHGLKFAWAAGNRLTIGISGYFGTNRITPWFSNDLHRLVFSYGTVYGEYHFRKPEENKFYNWSVISHIGRGYSSISGNGIPPNFQNSSSFWIFESGGNFNINLGGFIRFNAGLSYRIVSGVRLYGQTDWSLSGPCINLGVTLSGRGF